MSDDKKWLYGKFTQGGLNIGSYEDFDKSLSNEEDRKWYHDKATKMGLNVGSYDDFSSLFGPSDSVKEDQAQAQQSDRAARREARREERQARREAKRGANQPPAWPEDEIIDIGREPGYQTLEEQKAQQQPVQNEPGYTSPLDTETDPNALRRRQQEQRSIINPDYFGNVSEERAQSQYLADKYRAEQTQARERQAGLKGDEKRQAKAEKYEAKRLADLMQKAADLNPEYQKELDARNEELDRIGKQIDDMSNALVGDAELNVNLRQSPFYNSPLSKMAGTKEGRNLLAAENLVDEARTILNRGNRYTDEKDTLKHYGEAHLEKLSSPEFWTVGLSKISDGKRIREVLEKAQKQAGTLSKEDLEAGNLDKILTPDEMAVMDAWLAWSDAQILRAYDQSKGYKGGEISADAVAFMRDMALTAGISGEVNAALKTLFNGWTVKAGSLLNKFGVRAGTELKGLGGKALHGWATESGLNAAQKLGRGALDYSHKVVKNLVAAGLDSAVAVNFTPTLYANYSKQVITPDGNNLLRDKDEVWNENWWQNWKEYFTERGIGAGPGESVGYWTKQMGTKQIAGKLAGTKIARLATQFSRSVRTGKMATLGAFNMAEEPFEELVGAAMDKYIFKDKGALTAFWEPENLGTMMGGFAPLMGIQAVAGGVNVYALNRADRRYQKQKENLKFVAKKYGVDLSDAAWERYFSYFDTKVSEADAAQDIDITGAEMVEQMSKFTNLVAADAEENGLPMSQQEQEQFLETMFSFYKSAVEQITVQGAYEYQQAEKRQAKRDEIQQSLGGKQFWTDVEGEDGYVILIETADGNTAYGRTISDEGEEPDSVPVVFQDGTTGYVRRNDIVSRQNVRLQEYLDQQVQADQAESDRRNMEQQRRAQIEQLAQQFEIGVRNDALGLTPTDIGEDGVDFMDDKGTPVSMTWEQIGQTLGQPITTATEEELAGAQAGAEAKTEDDAAVLEIQINAGLKKKSLIQDEQGETWNIVKVLPGTIDQESGTAHFLLKNGKGDYWETTLSYDEFINPDMSEPAEVTGQTEGAGETEVQEPAAPEEPQYEVPKNEAGETDYNKMLEENPAAYAAELEKALGAEGREVAKQFIGEKIKAINKEAEAALKKMDTNKVVSLRSRAKSYQDVLDSLENPVAEAAPEIKKKEVPTFARLLGDGLGFSDIKRYVERQIERITGLRDSLEQPVFDGENLEKWEKDKAQYDENIAQANGLLNHFAQMKSVIDRVEQAVPGFEEAQARELTDADLEPQDGTELAAQMFSGGYYLTIDSYNHELIARGRGASGQTGENKAMIGLFRKPENGGHTIPEAAERLIEMRDEGYAGASFADEDARDIIIDLLAGVRTYQELKDYIATNRRAQFQEEAEYANGAMAKEIMGRYGKTVEEFMDELDGLRLAYLSQLLEKGEEFTNFEQNEKGDGSVPETETDTVLPPEQGGAEQGDTEGAGVVQAGEPADETVPEAPGEPAGQEGDDSAPGVLAGPEGGESGVGEPGVGDMPEFGEEPPVITPEAPTQAVAAELTPADIVDIYNGREKSKAADKGKKGRIEILKALYEANPELVQFRNEQDQANAISDVVELARKYPDLEISKDILSRIKGTPETEVAEEAPAAEAPAAEKPETGEIVEETPENQEENTSESQEKEVTSQEEAKEEEVPGVTRPLTEEEIRNSGAPSEFIAPAIAYIQGKQNLVNTIAYQNVIEYVRNKPSNLEQGGTDADQTQLGQGDDAAAGGEGGRSGGQGGGVAGETGDRGGVNEDSEGGVPPVPGEGSDSGVPQGEPDLFANADESADNGGGGNAGSTGVNGNGQGGPGSRGTSASVPGRRSSRPKGNPRRTVEEINKDIDDVLKALEDEFKKGLEKANSTLSIDLTGGLKNYNWGTILPMSFKLGYLMIEKSVRTFDEFVRRMFDKIGGLLSRAGMSDVEVDRYIKDLWDSPYEINGETHTLAEWSAIIGKRKLHEQINQDIEAKKKAQKKADAEVKEIIPCDEDNIIESLPFLLEAQQHDVLLAERQFFDETHQDRAHGYGHGYMFTNATGTGKTFTGLGIIKRFVRQGKGRVLIVTPTQTKVSDWAKDGKKMDITVTPLEDTNDKGSGVVATTYANFYQNPKLLEDTFDLIVYDESHRLMENQKGTGTENAGVHHLIANRDYKKTLARLERINPLWQQYRELAEEKASLDIRDMGTKRKEGGGLTEEEQERQRKLGEQMMLLEPKMIEALPALREKAKQETGKTKCVFLSATPFASHRSLAYTEGYIFSYPSEGSDYEEKSYFTEDNADIYLDLAASSKKLRDTFIHTKQAVAESYEDKWKLKAEGKWLLDTFKHGYLRSSRSVTPTQFVLNPAKLEDEEVGFSEKLQHDLCTMSGRPIDIEEDYSRDFPIEELYVGMDFNAAIDGVSENGQYEILGNYARGGKKGPVSDEILAAANIEKGGGFGRTLLDFNWSQFLFQAMKASVIGKRIKQHLAMGRKVTLFHSRMNQPKGENVVPVGPPFATAIRICREDANKLEVQGMHDVAEQIRSACDTFEWQFRTLFTWEQTLNFDKPVEQIIRQLATEKDYENFDEAHKKWEKEKAAAAASGKKFTKKEPELRASGVLLFNGEDDLADKPEVPAKFNDDAANNNVIVVQTQSGKEGISLHDTTGKHQRVLINISLPYSPIEFIQVEGRIYRLGVKSNAIFEYPLLGLALEYSHFAWKINQRAATTENLALGNQGRALMRSIKKGILERSGVVPLEGQGVGGKEFDSRTAYETTSSFDQAIEDYKKTITNPRSETKGLQGYFATPEPLGFKMIEWARLAEGENVLEPSAGIGAIARYVPKENGLTALEPTLSLKATLELLLSDQNKKVEGEKFDWYSSYSNKFDAVVMCPPIGEEGRTATAHVKKAFDHIGEAGRVVAVIPTSVAETMSFKKWLDGTSKDYENTAGTSKEAKNPLLVANIKLPLAAYPAAGEPMSLVVFDKVPSKELRKNAPEPSTEDWSDIGKIEDFFERIRNFELPPRIVSKKAKARKAANKYKREFNNLVEQGVVSFPDKPAVSVKESLVEIHFEYNLFNNIRNDLGLHYDYAVNEKGKKIKGTDCYEYYLYFDNITGDRIDSSLLDRYVKISDKLESPEEDFARLISPAWGAQATKETADKVRKIYELWTNMIQEMTGYTDGQLRRIKMGLPAEVRPGEIDQSLDARGIKEKFELNNEGNERREELFQKVWRIMSQVQPTIKVGRRGEADGSAGYFSFGPNILHFNSDEWNRSEPQRNAEVTVHEMIHMGTLWALEAYDAKKAGNYSSARQVADIASVLTPEVEAACKTLNDVFAQLSRGQNSYLFAGKYFMVGDQNEKYGHPKPAEMAAEMASDGAVEALKQFPIYVYGDEANPLYFAVKMEGDEPIRETNAYDLVYPAVLTILDKFNMESFEKMRRYNRLWVSSAPLGSSKQADLIYAQAISDGTIHTAPNGERSAMSPDDWAEVRTDSFKRKYGDWEKGQDETSVELDENGEPQVGNGRVLYRPASAIMARKEARTKDAIRSGAESVASRLGAKVVFHDTGKAKGWYDTEDGSVHIVLGQAEDVADAMATVFHEVVGHDGLRKLIGENFDRFLSDVYNGAHESIRKEIDSLRKQIEDEKRARGEDPETSIGEAVEEYLAGLAENGINGELEMSLWQRIKQAFFNMLRRAGVNVPLTDADLLYILWQSKRNLENTDNLSIFQLADRALMRDALRRQAESSHNGRPEGPDDGGPRGGVRFRGEDVKKSYTPTVPFFNRQDYFDRFERAENALKSNAKDSPEYKAALEEKRSVIIDFFDKADPKHPKLDAVTFDELPDLYSQIYADFYKTTPRYKVDMYIMRMVSTHRTIGTFAEYINMPYRRLIIHLDNCNNIDSLLSFYTHERQHNINEEEGLDATLAEQFSNDSDILLNELTKVAGGVVANQYWYWFSDAERPKGIADEILARLSEVIFSNPDYSTKIESLQLSDRLSKFVEDYADRRFQDSYRPAIQGRKYSPGSNAGRIDGTWGDDGEGAGEVQEPGRSPESPDSDPSGQAVRYRSIRHKPASPRIRRQIVRQSTVNEENDEALRLYNRAANSVFTRLSESFVDMYRSLVSAKDAIEKETGKKAKDSEDFVTMFNTLSSRMHAMSSDFAGKQFKAMREAISAITDEFEDVEFDDVSKYISIKSGLERNIELAKRDAREWYQAEAEKLAEKIRADKKLSDTEKQDKLDALYAELEERIKDVNAETDEKFLEFRQDDYGGITGWMSEYTDASGNPIDELPGMEPNESVEEYNARIRSMRHPVPGAETLEGAEGLAQMYVSDFENRVGTEMCDKLWHTINDCTKHILRTQYKSNVISKAQFDSLIDRLQFYVPLRGFSDETAGDIYTYYNSDERKSFTPPLLRAGGRMSVPDSPFGYIASMADSAFSEAAKNDAKRSLFRFVQARKDNSFITVADSYYRDTKQSNGKGGTIWQAVNPYTEIDPLTGKPFITDGMSIKAERDAMKRFKEAMLADQDVVKGKKNLGLRNSVAMITDKESESHIVRVKVLGDEYEMVFHGNPRMAQAINGELNSDSSDNAFKKFLRWLASMSTSRNPAFWVDNFRRDFVTSLVNLTATENSEYRRRYEANLKYAIRAIQLYMNEGKLKGANDVTEKGRRLSEVQAMWKSFIDNGGVTGMTVISRHDQVDATIRKFLKTGYYNGADASILVRNTGAIGEMFKKAGDFGESIEQIIRFATFMTSRQMGRGVNESISNAKEVTVNFNRKGSGRGITMDEAKTLGYSLPNGKWHKLSKPEQLVAVLFSQLSPVGRNMYLFFNANMQGLYRQVQNFKKGPAQTAAMMAGLAAMGFAYTIIADMFGGGDDDEKEYFRISEYNRGHKFKLPAFWNEDLFFLWPIPPEFAPFYEIGNIWADNMLKRRPDQNPVWASLRVMGEVLPANPMEPNSLIPAQVKPVVESIANQNYMGYSIYNKNQANKDMPGYTKAYDNTWGWLTDLSEWTNTISGGDYATKGWANFNPAVAQHIIEGIGGGLLTLIGQTVTTATNIATGKPAVLRTTPFLNRFALDTDEYMRDSYITKEYQYFKGIADETGTRLTRYRYNKPDEDYLKVEQVLNSKEFRYYELYKDYKKEIKQYQDDINAEDDLVTRKQLMEEQDAIKRAFVDECMEIFYSKE